jgi:hypothetical protein
MVAVINKVMPADHYAVLFGERRLRDTGDRNRQGYAFNDVVGMDTHAVLLAEDQRKDDVNIVRVHCKQRKTARARHR